MNHVEIEQSSSLAKLLRHGFILPHDKNRGLIVLLRGKAGTGKSTLALQILDTITTRRNLPSKIYSTIEQSREDVLYKLASMRVARAMSAALQPDDHRPCFTYSIAEFRKHCQLEGVGWRKLIEEYNSSHYSQLLPLYGEPELKQTKHNSELFDRLTNLARNADAGISVLPKDHDMGMGGEGRFAATEIRVLEALRLVEEIGNAGQIERERKPVAVLDGLSLLSTPERNALELQQIVSKLRTRTQLAILVFEPNDAEGASLDHHADMVIELTQRVIPLPVPYLIHEMCISKARYQDSALGNHQFKIRTSGLIIFLSLHFQMHHYNYMDLEFKRSAIMHSRHNKDSNLLSKRRLKRVPSDPASLLDLMFNPLSGESIVVLGPRNSFKTHLTLDFLARGSWGAPKRAQPGLLISLIDNAPAFTGAPICRWCEGLAVRKSCPHCRHGMLPNIRMFSQRPGYITPSEFFHFCAQRIEADKIKRIAFWDLTQVEYRFPLFKQDPLFLTALIDVFKRDKLRAVFMGETNVAVASAASAVADHVLYCWRSGSHWAKPPRSARQAGTTTSSLMLYVDRTPYGGSNLERAVYAIPIYDGLPKWPMSGEKLNDLRVTAKSDSFSALDHEANLIHGRIGIKDLSLG